MIQAIPVEIKKHIAKLLSERPDFIDTTFPDQQDGMDEDEEYLTYNALEMFDTIVIQEEFQSHIETLTEYLIYNVATKELRKATEMEDNFMRGGDQNGDPFREYDTEFLLSKCLGNKVDMVVDSVEDIKVEEELTDEEITAIIREGRKYLADMDKSDKVE